MAQTSPTPNKEPLGFIKAFEYIIEGKRVMRTSWPEGYYAYMDKQLMLQSPEDKHQWIISREDVEASDWELLN